MYKPYETTIKNQAQTLGEKFANISFSYVLYITILAVIGFVVLYSAANGNWNPWAVKQFVRFAMGFVLMIVLALTDIRFFMRYAYVLYFITLLLLIAVEVGKDRADHVLAPTELLRDAFHLRLPPRRALHGRIDELDAVRQP